MDWAASEFGFFYIVGHGIEPGVIDSLLGLSRAFFAQSAEQKHRIRHVARRAGLARLLSGWRRVSPRAGPTSRKVSTSAKSWGKTTSGCARASRFTAATCFPELPGFRESVLDYMSALTGLGHRLMTSIGRGLRLGDNYFVDRYTGSPTTLFRIFNYPARQRC